MVLDGYVAVGSRKAARLSSLGACCRMKWPLCTVHALCTVAVIPLHVRFVSEYLLVKFETNLYEHILNIKPLLSVCALCLCVFSALASDYLMCICVCLPQSPLQVPLCFQSSSPVVCLAESVILHLSHLAIVFPIFSALSNLLFFSLCSSFFASQSPQVISLMCLISNVFHPCT